MSVRWLSFQSFQHGQELISAINTLLIHLKLEAAGVADREREGKAKQAHGRILSFLESFEKIVDEVETRNAEPTLGTDVRIRQLAKSFVKATSNRRRFHSILFQNKIAGFRDLLSKQNVENAQILIESFEELRLLVEEHLYEDIEQVLGEV